MTTFADFGLDEAILKGLESLGFKEPLAIQIQTMTIIQDKHDLIALAQTGSGKTAACAIPICNRVNVDSPVVQALIIVPTRELALQYATETQKIGKYKGVKSFALYGGEDAGMQLAKLKHGVQILIATPGRLIDFIYSRSIDISNVETLVLDEADEMLSMGFYDDLEFIMQCLIHKHQTLLFSATMPESIRKIAKKHMTTPIEITLTTDQVSPASINHHFMYCQHYNRSLDLCELIKDMKPKQGIVFCHSRHQCEQVCKELQRHMDGVDYLHAGLTQDLRSTITGKFRTGRIRLLVATDVAARGLDFSEVTHVFIYQLSDDPHAYVHRSGRTGRREREGTVVSLVTDRELRYLDRTLQHIQREPLWIGPPPPPPSSHKPRPRKRPPR